MAVILKLSASEKDFISSLNRASGALGTFTGQMNVQLARSFTQADRITNQFNRGLGRVSNNLKSFSVSGFLGITVPLGLAAKFGSEAYAEYDSLKRSLATLEPTLGGVNSRIKELTELARLPALGFQQAISAEVRLRSVGIAVSDTTRILREFSNQVAQSGGGSQQFNEITYQLSQMIGKRKVLSQDLRPILEAAPSLSTYITKMFGTVSSDDISKQLAANGKTSIDFVRELLTELEKAPRVTGGWRTTLENLTDTMFRVSARTAEITDKLFGLTGKIEDIESIVSETFLGFEKLDPSMQKLILSTIALGGALPIVTFGISKMIDLYITFSRNMLTTSGAIGVLVVALGTLAAITLANTAHQRQLAEATKSVADVRKDAVSQVSVEVDKMKGLVDAIKKTEVGSKEYLGIKRQILQIAPQFEEYLGNNKASFDKLSVAATKYAKNLVNVANAEILAMKIRDNQEKIKAYDEDPSGKSTATTARKIGSGLDQFNPNVPSFFLTQWGKDLLKLTSKEKIQAWLDKGMSPYDYLMKGYDDEIKNLEGEDKAALIAKNKEYTEALNKLSEVIVQSDVPDAAFVPKDNATADKNDAEKKQDDLHVKNIAMWKERFAKKDKMHAEWLVRLKEGKDKAFEQEYEKQKQLKEIKNALQGTKNQTAILMAIAYESTVSEFYGKVKDGVKIDSDYVDTAAKNVTKVVEHQQRMDKAVEGLKSRLSTYAREEEVRRNVAKEDFGKKIISDLELSRVEFENLLNEGVVNLASSAVGSFFGSEDNNSFKRSLKSTLSALGDYAVKLGFQVFKIVKLKEALLKDPTNGKALALIAGGFAVKSIAAGISIGNTNRLARGGVTNSPIFTVLGDNPSGKELALPFERNGEFASDIAKKLNGSGGGGGGGGNFKLTSEVRARDIQLILTRLNNGT